MLQQKKVNIFILVIIFIITIGIVFINKKVNDNTDLISQNDQSQEIYNLQNDVKDLQSKLENIQSQLEDVQSKIDNGEY